jgi:hypothetical protein
VKGRKLEELLDPTTTARHKSFFNIRLLRHQTSMKQSDIISVVLFTLLFTFVNFFFQKVRLPSFLTKNMELPTHSNSKCTPTYIVAGCLTSFTHGVFAIITALLIHTSSLLDGTHAVFRSEPMIFRMDDLVAMQCAMGIGYMVSDTFMQWYSHTLPFLAHHMVAAFIWGYCLSTRVDMGIIGLVYLIGEAPNPFLNGRWLTRTFGFPRAHQICELGFVVMWFLVRQPLEAFLSYRFVLSCSLMPWWWRLAIVTGNIVTLLWTTEILGLIYRKFFKKNLPSSNALNERSGQSKTN